MSRDDYEALYRELQVRVHIIELPFLATVLTSKAFQVLKDVFFT